MYTRIHEHEDVYKKIGEFLVAVYADGSGGRQCSVIPYLGDERNACNQAEKKKRHREKDFVRCLNNSTKRDGRWIVVQHCNYRCWQSTK